MKKSRKQFLKKDHNTRTTLNKRIYKVIPVFILIVVQLLTTFMPINSVVKAEENEFSVDIGGVPNTVGKGEIFQVDVTIHNSSNKPIEKVKFLSQNGMEILGTSEIKRDIDGGKSETFSLSMVYSGSDSILPVSIGCACYFADETTPSGEIGKSGGNIFFKEEDRGDQTPPTNTAKYKPDVKVKTDIKMPVFEGGKDVVLTLPIVNDSIYDAKDITVSIDTSNESSLPFTFEQIILTSNIEKIVSKKNNKISEENISYNIRVKDDAVEKIYPLKLDYQFSNAHNDTFTFSEIVHIKVLNNKTSPFIIMENIQTHSSDPSPGNIMGLKLIFKNQGSLPAKDIKVSLKGLSSEGVTTYKTADSKFISQINGNEKGETEYMLIISDNCAGGNVSLQANVEYKDGGGNKYSEDFQFFIRIKEPEKEEEKEETKPEISIRDLNFPKDKIQAGEEFSIGFVMDNLGTNSAKNIKVSLACEEGLLPKSSSVIQTEILEKGQSKDLEFDIFATLGAITKNHLITINMEYEYEQNSEDGDKGKIEKETLTQYIGVYVEKEKEKDEDDEKQKTVPKIIINMYSFEPEVVKAGHEFILKLSFLNTSKIAPIRNVKATFSAKEGVFIPASSSNTFFIENMATQGVAEREVELFVKSDAQPKSHILNLNFEYEDEEGNQYTTAEEISIPVTQEQRLTVGQINLPPEGYEGQPIPIFVDYFNMGKSVLYNLMVTFEGEGFYTENPNYFAGNFEPGRSDYFETMVTPNVAGEAMGELIFSFEDETGIKNEVRKEIKLNVMGMEMPPMIDDGYMDDKFPEGMFPEEESNKLLTPLNIGIGSGILVVIAVALIIIIRKRRNRKEGMTFDE